MNSTKTNGATQRPWQQDKTFVRAHVTNEIGEAWPIVAQCDCSDLLYSQGEANAALIVQAVNQFQALNEVAEAAKIAKDCLAYESRFVSDKEWDDMPGHKDSLLALTDALEALAKLQTKPRPQRKEQT